VESRARRNKNTSSSSSSSSAYHEVLPGVGTQRVDEVVLASGGGPNGCQLSQATNEGKVAEDAKDEAIDKGNRAPRREHQAHGSSNGDPCAIRYDIVRGRSVLDVCSLRTSR